MGGEVSKKILWIFVFLILAAIAVLGVLFIRGYHAGKEITSITATAEPSSSAAPQPVELTIAQPAADVATTSAKIAVAGTTAPNATVVITGATDDYLVTADGSGNFGTTVTLDQGLNQLVFQAYSQDGATTTAKKNIVYTKGGL